MSLSIHVDGHLDCFHVLPSVNGAAVNNEAHVSFELRVFSRYMPRRGIAGLRGSSQFFEEPPYCIP